MRLAVAFTANNRPHYLRETLGYWEQARWSVVTDAVVRCEPGNPEVVEVWKERGHIFRTLTLHVNGEQLGPLRNPWHAYETAFAAGYPFVVLAEDDSLVSTDVLEFFSYCASAYRGNPRVLAACAFRHRRVPGGLAGVRRDSRFRPTIWGTWPDRWRYVLSPTWDHDYSHRGWDWHIQEELVDRQGYQVVAPCESRSQVSGQHGGAHLQPGDYEAHLSDCFTPDISPQAYQDVTPGWTMRE